MTVVRRVLSDRAGPNALGILVPPGPRTVAVIRPRSLPWDLVLVHTDQRDSSMVRFLEMTQAEAEKMLPVLARVLEAVIEQDTGRVELVPLASRPEAWVRVLLDGFVVVACSRTPGQPYQPLLFGSVGEAKAAADRIASACSGSTRVPCEIYFNTRHFRASS
jgi:hypothetical protein